MTKAMARRAVLVALPAAIALPASAAFALPAAADPHLAWLKRWRELFAAIDAHHTGEGPEADLLYEEKYAIENLIASTRAETLAGVLAQVEWLVADGELYWACGEHHTVANNILSSLRAGVPATLRG